MRSQRSHAIASGIVGLILLVIVAGVMTGHAAPPFANRLDRGSSFEPKRSLSQPTLLGARSIDVESYDIDLTLDHPGAGIAGSVAVQASATVANVDRVRLHMGDNLEVDAIAGASGPLQYAHEGGLLAVDLPEPVGPGDPIAFTIEYHGTGNVFSDFGMVFGFVETGTDTETLPIIWTMNEPDGARLWFPCFDEPIDKAMVTLTVTVDAAFTVTSNGRPTGIVDNGATRTWSFAHGHPISTYLVVLNAGPLEMIADTWDPGTPGVEPMPIEHYVWPDLVAAAEEDFNITPAALTVYSELLGEYPFRDEKYGHTVFPWPGAMEHQTNTSYGADLITGNHSFDDILVHELAHQWFGDYIGPASWAEIWLNESFATYAEVFWFESQYGPFALPYVMDIFRFIYFWTHGEPHHPIYAPPQDHLFCSAEYYKGAFVLHMLRWQMGDEAFFQGLRDYLDTNAEAGVVVTPDVIAACEAASGQNLDWFFRQWVYGPGFPIFEYEWQNARMAGLLAADLTGAGSPGDQGVVTVSFNQTQSWDVFRVPLDLRIFTGAGTGVVDTTVWMEDRQMTVEVPVTASADSIWVDYNVRVLGQFMDQTSLVSTPDFEFKPGGMLITPNPFPGAVAIRMPVPGARNIVLRIYDAGGRFVRELETLPGMREVQWDGADVAGRSMSPGVYFLRVRTPEGVVSHKVVKTR